MKISVSLPDDDVAFLDEVSKSAPFDSRSAALHEAIKLMRVEQLKDAYTKADAEWYSSWDAWTPTLGVNL
ncbi:MAG: hypothetical protein JJE28_05355 [Actinomycetales bacterium]|nr:hypothetical protein [Actinomycetales bacterium]